MIPLFVSVFNDNPNVLISMDSATTPPISVTYSSCDITDQNDVLCASKEVWALLGPTPDRFTLMPIQDHPVLGKVLAYLAMSPDDVEAAAIDDFPDGFNYLGFEPEEGECLSTFLSAWAEWTFSFFDEFTLTDEN